jgi:plastocyanin
MTRRRFVGLAVLLGLVAVVFATTTSARSSDEPRGIRIAMLDDCDSNDPAWAQFGGCALRGGSVSVAEFFAELDSPLSAAVVGHQSWRNSPSYLTIRPGTTVRVVNSGGRPHTFTEVAAFGGGKVPLLNEGLTVAPECPGSLDVAPGESIRLSGLGVGNHRFECCIHPWMRALVKVKADDDGGIIGDD